MNRLIILIGLIVLPIHLVGQIPNDKTSILTTKSGMRYVGLVTEDKDALNVELLDGNTARVALHDVKRYLPHGDITVYEGGKYHMTRGWHTMLSQGVSFGGGPNGESNSSQFNIILGKYLQPRSTVGLGVGSEANNKDLGDFTINTQVLTVFGHARYDLTQNRRKLFAYGRLGYGFANVDPELMVDEEGGLNAGLGLGILFASTRKTKWSIMVGYSYQKASGTQNYIDAFGNEASAQYDLAFNRVYLTFAFEVNRKASRKVK